MNKGMINQKPGYSEEQHSASNPALMDWCRDLFEDVSSKPADLPTATQDQWKLKETSSYGKSSCVLPITFFDIQSNIQFLNQCNPLSIQVVDCDKHPWYYKKYTRSKSPVIPFEDMADTTKRSSKPYYDKLTGVDVVKCIDLTEVTDNSFTNSNSDLVNSKTNLNKVVNNENKMSSITNTKKKKAHRLSNVTRDDLEKLKARSQINLSKIDLKHNTGLVGLKIIPSIGFKNVSVSANTKKCTKPLASKIENNEADECFSAASKTLGLLGTIIVPVNNQMQCENVYKEDLSNKTHDCKVPSQSSVQVIVTKPESTVTNTQTHIKGASLPASNTDDNNNNHKKHSKVKLSSSTQALGKKTNEHVKLKKATKKLESDMNNLKQTGLPCTYVNTKDSSCQAQENKNKHITEDTSRSKSPIFPCNGKQKTQSELEKHLKLNVKADVEPNKNEKASKARKSHDLGQDNMVFIKDWPKSTHKFEQTPSTIQKKLCVSADKNASTISDHLNKTQSQQTSPINNSTEKYYENTNISLHDTDYTTHTEPDKQYTSMITPTNISIKNIPKPSNECMEPSVYNLNTNKARRDDFKKDSKIASAINNFNNEIRFKKPNLNNNKIQSNTKTNLNTRDKNLKLLYQQHFVSISRNKIPPKVSDKTAKISKIQLPKAGPPHQIVAINMSLPVQKHVSSKPESTEAISGVVSSQNNGACLVKQQTRGSNKSETDGEYAGRIPSAATSQNISARLLKQPVPGTIPAYCKVNGTTNNFARHPNVYGTNENTEWDPRLHFPVPPFMHPPPLFLPPPPLPSSLERFHIIINSLQNRAKNPMEEVKKNDANNTKDDKTMVDTEIKNNSSHTMKNNNTVETSTLKLNLKNRFRSKETKSNKLIINPISHKPYLPPTNKTNGFQIQLEKSTIATDKSYKNLPEKDTTNHNTHISILHDITITPVAKDAMNTTQYKNTNQPENNLNLSMKPNHRAFNEKRKYDRTPSLPSGNNDKHEKKPKPGPLCMKNRTGPFAVKKAEAPAGLKLPTPIVNSQPKKGYSPPILPIPTFQTMLAQRHDLQVFMLNKQSITNPNRIPIPNSSTGDKGSRKRLHFEEKDANEVKKVKKISLEDYQNRNSVIDKGDGLVNDTAGMLVRKIARKSEKSFKSAKSLADVVNQSLASEL